MLLCLSESCLFRNAAARNSEAPDLAAAAPQGNLLDDKELVGVLGVTKATAARGQSCKLAGRQRGAPAHQRRVRGVPPGCAPRPAALLPAVAQFSTVNCHVPDLACAGPHPLHALPAVRMPGQCAS